MVDFRHRLFSQPFIIAIFWTKAHAVRSAINQLESLCEFNDMSEKKLEIILETMVG